MNTQPEALRLADELDSTCPYFNAKQAAAELRRLHKENEELRQAPSQPEQEPVSGKGKEFSEQLKLCARNVAFAASGHVDMSSAAMQEMFALIDHVCTAIDSPPALAQPEKKPVAWVLYYINEGGVSIRETFYTKDRMEFHKSHIEANRGLKCEVTPLYTAPPKREWVIEAKLKEKNK